MLGYLYNCMLHFVVHKCKLILNNVFYLYFLCFAVFYMGASKIFQLSLKNSSFIVQTVQEHSGTVEYESDLKITFLYFIMKLCYRRYNF